MNSMKEIKQTKVSTTLEGQVGGKKKIVTIFNIPLLQELNLQQTINYNEYVLTQTKTKAFPQSFLQAEVSYQGENIIFFQNSYDSTLDQVLAKGILAQKEVLVIFEQILKSIYSLYLDGLGHRNLRFEHFALSNGVWKLKSLVYNNDRSDIASEFTMDPKYQAPEQYSNFDNVELDTKPILVWNLGSLILDMLLNIHKLKDQATINKFKNQEFSLSAVGVNKKISPQLSQLLSRMLHYNPEKRMLLHEVFENEFFSPQISAHAKKNKLLHSNHDLNKSMGGQLLSVRILERSSMKKTSVEKDPSHVIPSNQMLQINNIGKSYLLKSKKKEEPQNADKIQDDQQFYDMLDVKTNIFLKDKKRKKSQDQCDKDIKSDEQLKNFLNIYKTYIDRSLLLEIAARKITEINYNEPNREQFILINQFSVYYVSLIELDKIVRAINAHRNIYKVSEDRFTEFINTANFKVYSEEVNLLYQQKIKTFEEIARKLENLPYNKLKLMKRQDFSDYVKHRNFRTNTFSQIKKMYRHILKMAYDIVSIEYNNTNNQNICRLSMYVVYCMTIDKLYIESDIEDNFSYFIEWNTVKSTRRFNIKDKKYAIVSVKELQKYFDTAPLKTLIHHSKKILQKYYKI